MAPLGIRQTLRGYKIEAGVTHTPLAQVYRGRDRQRRRPVLVKLLPALAGGRVAASRIANELPRIAALRHPNIVPIEEWGDVNGVPFVITPDEPAVSLAESLASSRLDRETAVTVLRGIAGALDYAHGMGLHHGGLEPAVVKLTTDGTPLVADFGLARLASASQPPRRNASCFGSAAYAAPERILGEPAGPAGDVYAFAAIGYDVLTGTAPFGELGASAPDQFDAHLRRQPAPPSTRDPTLPAPVDDVLLRGLAKDPAGRWSSCGAMLRALERALSTAATKARMSEAPRGGRAGVVLRLAAAVGLPLVVGAVLVTHHPPVQTISTKPAGIASAPAAGAPPRSSSSPSAAPSSSPTPRALGLTIKLSTQTARRGDALIVSGAGFDPAGTFVVTLDQPGGAFQLQPPSRLAAGGSFSVRILIPRQATPGPATVSVCGIAADGRSEGCAQQQMSVAS
jgi:serine/threonine-protein kinase